MTSGLRVTNGHQFCVKQIHERYVMVFKQLAADVSSKSMWAMGVDTTATE